MTKKNPFNKLISLTQEDAKVLALHGLATQNLSLKKYIEQILKSKVEKIKKHEQ